MRYSLWSHGRLVGHTDLDIHTITENLRQGFVEPTEEGRLLLRDATAVWRAMAEMRRTHRAYGGARRSSDLDLFSAACDRREGPHLELRGETGQLFECHFMRVYDLFDVEATSVEEVDDSEDIDEEVLNTAWDDGAEPGTDRALSDEEIETAASETRADWENEEMFHSAWPPPVAPDPRWDTMQYHLQVFLKGPPQTGDWEGGE